jgi:hypothetical protein
MKVTFERNEKIINEGFTSGTKTVKYSGKVVSFYKGIGAVVACFEDKKLRYVMLEELTVLEF